MPPLSGAPNATWDLPNLDTFLFSLFVLFVLSSSSSPSSLFFALFTRSAAQKAMPPQIVNGQYKVIPLEATPMLKSITRI